MTERRCPDCDRAADADARFCAGCGVTLDSKQSPPVSISRASREDLFAHLREGEQRPATILMSDITGFSKLSAHADPQWLFDLMNDVLSELSQCLVGHGAHIDKFVGDEVMALFGVPLAQEDSVERALLAALAMNQRMRALNDEGRFGDARLELHTGINVGPVMAGPVGRGAHTDFTVIGDSVNIAKRLEDSAPPGEIYVSGAARDVVDEAFEFERVGPLTLAGMERQVEVFRLIAADQAVLSGRGHFDDQPRDLTRHVELARLDSLAVQVLSENAATVVVAGPAGIGKTFTIGEWRKSDAAAQFRVVSTTCHTCSAYFPLLPLADVVTRLMGLQLRGWPPSVVGDAEAALQALPLSAGTCDVISRLLDVFEDAPDEDLRDFPIRLADALCELLDAMAQERALCLILEDAEKLDETSATVITELVGALHGKLLLILTSREPSPAWLDGLDAEFVHLHRLSQPAMRDLVQRWSGPGGLPRSTVDAICNRADGHPHFAREMVRCLCESGDSPPEAELALPGSLHELFLAQLDRLALPTRRMLQAAAIVGEPLSLDMLPAVLEEPEIERELPQIIGEGLLRPGATPDQFIFGPSLLFEVAYDAIPEAQRRILHGRAADYLVARMTEDADALIHAAAHHAYMGWRDERAVNLLLRSARALKAHYAVREAIQVARSVIEVAAEVEDTQALFDRRLETLLLMAQCHEITGELDEAEAALAEAKVMAEDCTDLDLRAQVLTASGTLALMQGKPESAEERFTEALAIWDQVGSPTRSAHMQVGMALCAIQRGDRSRAMDLMACAASIEGAEDWVTAAAENNLGVMLMVEGRYAEAQQHLLNGLRANQSAEDRRGVAQSRCSLGELYYRLARLDEAEQMLTQAIADAEEIEDAQCLALSQAWLKRVHCLGGSHAEASQTMASPVEASPGPEIAAIERIATTEQLLALGDDEQVRECLLQITACDLGADDEAACANAEVDLLVVGLEAALVRGNLELADRLSEAIAGCLDRAVDGELIAYACWVMSLHHDQAVEVARLCDQDMASRTCFDLRARRLAAQMRQQVDP